jgi:hypothetical protein
LPANWTSAPTVTAFFSQPELRFGARIKYTSKKPAFEASETVRKGRGDSVAWLCAGD